MALPEPVAARRRLHTRRIVAEGFLREDGLFDLDATLTDLKDADYEILSGVRPAGTPVHEMRVRLTIDRHFNITDAVADTTWAPYTGYCEVIAPAYRQLVGLNLFQGFRKAMQERFAEVKGCTHLTELLLTLPTVALQTFATLIREDDSGDRKPYQLDRCHALDSSGAAAQRYYPRWHRPRSFEDSGNT
ncbi:DUF2889 domain-containing protein [Niveibacterium umoris]|uniref:DUF2889 domain-containing protein n=1 Tax=Niveibacterium umoris TaxID=1193620 RepID=A0A840BMG5_9RHOO|nr:DUF2889 domain-containing protein [Niveibacterium umoris]MBB4012719.1 hypothetical protein [Niveibacterium umoris]